MRQSSLSLIVSLLLCVAPLHADVEGNALDDYERDALDLVAAFDAHGEVNDLGRRAQGLLNLSAYITPNFIARQPECGEYLNAALVLRERWQELDAETIERDYHDDAALPVEGTPPVCYHMKDLIVHPATVLVLLREAEPDMAQARREIDEVIAHIAAVRALM